MDIVLGISMAPDSIQMVLLQGENADGATVDEREFTGTTADDSPTVDASDRVLAAILATRNDATAAGLELSAVGVACTDTLEAAALRDALSGHELENVLLVTQFMAAAALTQFVGGAMGYERTALLFVESDIATLAVVETSDGSVADVQLQQLNNESGATAELIEMIAGLDELETRPDGLFVVGSGVEIAAIKRQLEEATALAVSAPEEPETALARGAALASATLFASETAALAYAQDPGTAALDASGLPEYASDLPEYLSVAGTELGEDDVAYSAVADEEASAPTVVIDAPGEGAPRRRRVLLVGSAVTVAAISAALALEVALGLGLRTTVGLLPAPIQNIIAPVEQAIAPELGPVVARKALAPKPLIQPAGAAVPAAPVPAAPAVPVPAAPGAPVPVVVPPIAPAPVPQILLPDPPASPPVVQAPAQQSPPAESPQPNQVPPPQSPPPNQPPPEQGPQPSPGRGGGHPGNPGDGGPVSGPGPIHGAPGGGGPHGGEPYSGGPGHGTPGGGPPEGSGPSGGEPHSGGPGHETPGGAPPEGSGPSGGEPHSGGPTSGSETPGSSGPVGETPGSSGPVGGSETPGSSGPVGGSDIPDSSGPASSSPSDSGGSAPSDSGGSAPSDSGGSAPSDSGGSSDSGSSDSGSGGGD